MKQQKMPKALEDADKAYAEMENEVFTVLGEMERWSLVRDEVLAWASSLTTTNCPWSSYGLARLIVDRWHQKLRQ